jgi:thiol-disulfide isomerase/thioredoxin
MSKGLLRWCLPMLFALAASMAASAADRSSAPLGQTADGKAVRGSDFDNKAVVVMFWASWCPHCRSELPVLERLQRAAGANLQVVAVNVEDAATFRRVNSAIAEKLKLLLTSDANHAARKAFEAPTGIPYTVVLNRDGTVNARFKGWSDDSVEGLVESVNSAIGAQPK